MRVLTAAACWKYAGGRIINLHHGLLPSFPGIRLYHDAYANRMLTYGATCHFIVAELDAGNQIINQATFTVPPGKALDNIIRIGEADNEPRCLVEGANFPRDRNSLAIAVDHQVAKSSRDPSRWQREAKLVRSQ